MHAVELIYNIARQVFHYTSIFISRHHDVKSLVLVPDSSIIGIGEDDICYTCSLNSNATFTRIG
jgi:hypothetical protein